MTKIFNGKGASARATTVMGSLTAWAADLHDPPKAEEAATCVTMMMEGLATVGDADYPETAEVLEGCGWLNDHGDWSINTLDNGELPKNLYPPLSAAREILNKYTAVVVRSANAGKRKQTSAEEPEEDTADDLFNNGVDAAARAHELPEGWQSAKQIKKFPGFGGFLDDIRAGGAPSRDPEQRAPGTLPSLVMDDLSNLDTYGTAAMQSHQISGISNHGLITTRKVPQPTKAEFFLRLDCFVQSKGDTEEARLAKEYVGTLRYLSDLDYPFDVICAFDAATRGRWRAANKTTVDRNSLCIDFLLRRGVETDPTPEGSQRGNRGPDTRPEHICKKFNDPSGCNFKDNCRFKHKCSKCGSFAHSGPKCTK